MTPWSLGSLSADLDEKADPPDDILDESVGEGPHELEETALDGAKLGLLRLRGGLVKEGAGRHSEPGGDPRHEIGRGDEPAALDSAHRLGCDIDFGSELLLRQAGVVAEGSHASPDPRLFRGSGHPESLGDGPGVNQDASSHVMRLDLPGPEG